MFNAFYTHSKWKVVFKALETPSSIVQSCYVKYSASYLTSSFYHLRHSLHAVFLFCTWNVGLSLQQAAYRSSPSEHTEVFHMVHGRIRLPPETEILPVGFCVFKNSGFLPVLQQSPYLEVCAIQPVGRTLHGLRKASKTNQILWRTFYMDLASLSIFIWGEEKRKQKLRKK